MSNSAVETQFLMHAKLFFQEKRLTPKDESLKYFGLKCDSNKLSGNCKLFYEPRESETREIKDSI